MRQHASSRENDTLPRLISAHFFLSRAARGRCDKQGAEGNPHRARAPRRQPEVCHRSADSRYVCCAQSTASLRVTLSTRLQNSQLTSYLIHAVHAGVAYTWFLQRGWLPMATNYDWLGGVRYNGSCCNGDGRSRPTVPSIHVHLHCYRLAWVLCHRSRRGSKLSIFETRRHCDALTELILTHRAASRVSLSFARKCGPKLAGFLSR